MILHLGVETELGEGAGRPGEVLAAGQLDGVADAGVVASVAGGLPVVPGVDHVVLLQPHYKSVLFRDLSLL